MSATNIFNVIVLIGMMFFVYRDVALSFKKQRHEWKSFRLSIKVFSLALLVFVTLMFFFALWINIAPPPFLISAVKHSNAAFITAIILAALLLMGVYRFRALYKDRIKNRTKLLTYIWYGAFLGNIVSVVALFLALFELFGNRDDRAAFFTGLVAIGLITGSVGAFIWTAAIIPLLKAILAGIGSAIGLHYTSKVLKQLDKKAPESNSPPPTIRPDGTVSEISAPTAPEANATPAKRTRTRTKLPVEPKEPSPAKRTRKRATPTTPTEEEERRAS